MGNFGVGRGIESIEISLTTGGGGGGRGGGGDGGETGFIRAGLLGESNIRLSVEVLLL